eukprot:scaffold5974_cov158-Ochromonas_danica.AAC.22
MSGWLEKKGNVRKIWKKRYFFVDQGLLRYYSKGPIQSPGSALRASAALEGTELRGQYNLLGADLAISEENQWQLTIKVDKRTQLTLRADNSEKALCWQHSLIQQIRYTNSRALGSGSRLAEAIAWYYELQADLFARYEAFLRRKILVDVCFSEEGEEENCAPSRFLVEMTADHAGLLFTLLPANRSALSSSSSRLASLFNGRVVHFGDIQAIAFAALGQEARGEDGEEWFATSSSPLPALCTLTLSHPTCLKKPILSPRSSGGGGGKGLVFSLYTKGSEELHITLLGEEDVYHHLVARQDSLLAWGRLWLTALCELITFLQAVPIPASRSVSMAYSPLLRSAHATAASGNSQPGRGVSEGVDAVSLSIPATPSGLVYVCASDVQLIIDALLDQKGVEQMVGLAQKVSLSIGEVVKLFQRILLLLLPDICYNKEAALVFGERCEEFLRVLGDSEQGILNLTEEGLGGEASLTGNANKEKLMVLQFHLGALTHKLQDAVTYLTPQTKNGWLVQALLAQQSSSPSSASARDNSTRIKWESMDYEIMHIINTLIKALVTHPASSFAFSSTFAINTSSSSSAPPTPESTRSRGMQPFFERRDYAMAVDAVQAVQTLGGSERIVKEIAKERALAQLLQADATAVHAELLAYHNHPRVKARLASASTSTSASKRWSSFDSYQTSMDATFRSSLGGNCLSRYLCCCCRSNGPKRQNDGATAGEAKPKGSKVKALIQLEEPLIIA